MYQEQVTFGRAVSRAFSNYCNFSGRASRSEYWWFVLFTTLLSWALSMLNVMVFDLHAFNWLGLAFSLVCLLPTLGLVWRRLHDVGRAGGWYFIGLIPLVGWIILLVWLCKASQEGPNRFGEEPNMVQ